MKKKKVLTLIATLTASTLTAITITNRILCKLATSDHYLDEDEGEYYDWRFERFSIRKKEAVRHFFSFIRWTPLLPLRSGNT